MDRQQQAPCLARWLVALVVTGAVLGAGCRYLHQLKEGCKVIQAIPDETQSETDQTQQTAPEA